MRLGGVIAFRSESADLGGRTWRRANRRSKSDSAGRRPASVVISKTSSARPVRVRQRRHPIDKEAAQPCSSLDSTRDRRVVPVAVTTFVANLDYGATPLPQLCSSPSSRTSARSGIETRRRTGTNRMDAGNRPARCHPLGPFMNAGYKPYPPVFSRHSPLPPDIRGPGSRRTAVPTGRQSPPSHFVRRVGTGRERKCQQTFQPTPPKGWLTPYFTFSIGPTLSRLDWMF